MPKGKKGFSSGAENHRYRSTDAGAESAAGEGAPAKRPRDGDSAAAGHNGQRCALPSCDVLRYNEQVVADAGGGHPERPPQGGAEVDARRSFVALYAPSVVGTKWPELVLPGGSSVVPAAVFNCPAPEGTQEQWVQMALYGGAFVFGVLADVLEAKNARECKGKVDVPESAHQKQLHRKNTWQRFAAPRTDQHSTGKASILDGNVFYLPSESDPCGGQGVGDRGPAAALINMAGVRALVKVTITMGPEEEPLGAMRSEGATDLGD